MHTVRKIADNKWQVWFELTGPGSRMLCEFTLAEDAIAWASYFNGGGRPTGPFPTAARVETTLQQRVAQLEEAIARIDGINDNPAVYNPAIEEVLRTVREYPADHPAPGDLGSVPT